MDQQTSKENKQFTSEAPLPPNYDQVKIIEKTERSIDWSRVLSEGKSWFTWALGIISVFSFAFNYYTTTQQQIFDHHKLIETLRSQHAEAISKLNQDHARELAIVEGKHAKEIRLIEQQHDQTMRTLSHQVTKLETRNEMVENDRSWLRADLERCYQKCTPGLRYREAK